MDKRKKFRILGLVMILGGILILASKIVWPSGNLTFWDYYCDLGIVAIGIYFYFLNRKFALQPHLPEGDKREEEEAKR
ncbi:MAG: hypothetical protein FWD70_03990 [Desulfuromonadales bacterium]|nr:hypothetical protein [Desulfuromonadales bacterium]